MKIISLILIIAFGFYSFADDISTGIELGNTFISLDGEKTYYHQLEEKFKISEQPTKKELLGWISGRCFSVKEQNEPYGVLLVGIESKWKNNPGPIFGDEVQLCLGALSRNFNNNHSDYFDELTPSLEESIEASIKYGFLDYASPAKILKGSYVGSSQFYKGVVDVHVRKLGDIFVARRIVKNHSSDMKAMCYFFKKIK